MSSPSEFANPLIYAALADCVMGSGFAPRSAAVNVVGTDSSWAAKCCSDLDKLPGDALTHTLDMFGITDRSKANALTVDSNIRELLKKRFSATFRNVRLAPQQLVALGLPIHLRLARDWLNEPGWRPTWTDIGLPISAAWLEGEPTLDLADAFHLWQQIFTPEVIRRRNTLQTRLVAVSENSKGERDGKVANLSVSLIDWTEDAPKPATGFIRHASCVGYCLDEEFRSGLLSSSAYLEGIGLAFDTHRVEWRIWMSNPQEATPFLTGGSAGAAFALAAGSLLAKHSIFNRPHTKSSNLKDVLPIS